MKSAVIHRKKLEPILRRHPWIFSGAIHWRDPDLQDGDWVTVLDEHKQQLGYGHFHKGSIAVKMISFGPEAYQESIWEDKFNAAWNLRQTLGLTVSKVTNCFRLIHGEADGLPGLIVDIYSDLAVVQCHTIGMFKNLQHIQAALLQISGGDVIHHIILKSKDCLPADFAKDVRDGILYGDKTYLEVIENGHRFQVNILESQKTGLFLDQRENRQLLAQIAENKRVLNTFCYTGGFSIYAGNAGASEVWSVDASAKAIEMLGMNIKLNLQNENQHQVKHMQINDFWKEVPKDYFDIIILDPPAFAKNKEHRHQAIQAYKRLNLMAMQLIKRGGILMSFSCSQVVTEDIFYHTCVAAGIESGRDLLLLRKMSQGQDHPVSLFHPEGSYLKGLMFYVR
ncbi:MAG: class I SAM-dependent rRNA methyltransferase [Saprospiraceae bacterium]|nr:class I SAM-dependent rRNA methyltransferase [Saprospiraceae bacterium]MBK7797009.1 class I SAM-dependent rRNA methyltransferase [Saprospiraceae bacterium]MBK8152185.1 class I SAM-dependent rRNA methyltransferase [Saprospiraceae bacterium]MBK9377514.1 class I SAM-dependent rRNA methyltransferase [Saprospiraceae bacterium]